LKHCRRREGRALYSDSCCTAPARDPARHNRRTFLCRLRAPPADYDPKIAPDFLAVPLLPP
jgi:hypothetical protein